MKKVIIIIVSLLIFSINGAPEINIEQNKDVIERALFVYNEYQYEEEFERFIDHLGYKESGNDWTTINDINCFGEWQFAYGTLKHLGYGHITPEKFKRDSSIFPRELQLKVLKTLIQINELSLGSYKEFIGKTINGVPITRGGLLAGMHLGGCRGIKMYLSSNGIINNKDMYGTKISDYIREFSIYELKNKNDSLKYLEIK